MSMEDINHKRFPHFIHEQPAIAPCETSLSTDEVKEKGEVKSKEIIPPDIQNKEYLLSLTPVEIPENGDIISRTSSSVRSQQGKERSLSSVSLDMEMIKKTSHRSRKRQRTPITYRGNNDDTSSSRMSDSASALSKYLDTSQEISIYADSSMEELRVDSRCASSQTDIANESIQMYSTSDEVHRVSLGLKPIVPISSCDSIQFRSPDKGTVVKQNHEASLKSSDKVRIVGETDFSLNSKTGSYINPVTPPFVQPTSSSPCITLPKPSNASVSSMSNSIPVIPNKTTDKKVQSNKIMPEITKANQHKNVTPEHLCTQSTQTDISSLDILFQTHRYPEQVYPKSVRTGIYYISDSPLEPIEEHAESTTDENDRDSHENKNINIEQVNKIFAENTFSSSGWTTVDEETVNDTTSDSHSSATEYEINPIYKMYSYDGYEPDTD